MSASEPLDATLDDAASAGAASRAARVRGFLRGVPWSDISPAALATGAIVVAIVSQLLITRWVGVVPKPGYGFLLAVAMFGAAMYLQRQPPTRPTPPAANARDHAPSFQLPFRWEVALVAAVMLLAAFFRFWRFLDFPPGVWYDEAVTSSGAVWIRDNGPAIWHEPNFGRPTLFLYLLVGAFEVFGYTVFAMRLVPALAGLAAVFAFYFLARWLLGPIPALVATALLAVSRWAVTFSRVSWEAALQPLFEILAVYFFVRALETKGRLSYVFWSLAGGALAGGIYTYIAFRFVPLVMLFFLLYITVTRWRLMWNHRAGIVVYALAFLIVVAPIANFALNNQDLFLQRARAVSVFKEIDEKETYQPLRSNLQRSAQMVNVRGDHNGRHNLPNAPMADNLTAALFVLGFGAALISYRSWRRGMLPIWFAIMLVPGILTISLENPSAIRGVGAIPPLFLMVGLALAVAYASLARYRLGLVAFAAFALTLVAGSAALNYNDIFNRQAHSEIVYDAFTPRFQISSEIVAARAHKDRVLVARHFLGHPLLPILARGLEWEPYSPGDHIVFPHDGRDVVIVLDENQTAIIPHLRRLYPNLLVEDEVDPFDRPILSTLTIPQADIAASHALDLSYEQGGVIRTERAPLDRVWSEQELAHGPVTATWQGYLWSPVGGPYEFLATSGEITLVIDGQELAGDATISELAPGEHAVTITATIAAPGPLLLDVQTTSGRTQATAMLYGASLGPAPFEVILHRGDDVTGDVVAIGRVPFAVPLHVTTGSVNAIEYRATFTADRAGNYTFALDGSSSAQLILDGDLLVDNGGAHPRRRVETTTFLTSREYELIVQYTVQPYPDWSLHVEHPNTGWRRLDGTELSPPREPYRPPALVILTPDWSADAAALAALPAPYALAVLPDTTVAVSSGRTIGILDEDLRLLRSFDLNVDAISDIAATPDGRIAVVDGIAKAFVLVSADDGAELMRVGEGFESAAGVTVDGTRAIIASPSGGRVYAVSLETGQLTLLAPYPDDAPVRARQPSDVAVSDDGTLFLTDFEGQNIIIAPAGAPVTSVRGVRGTGMQIPRIAISGRLLFVTEAVSDRLVVYDVAGGHRGSFVFPARHGGTRPSGIDVDAQGRLLVAGSNGLIQRFVVGIPPRTQEELDAIE